MRTSGPGLALGPQVGVDRPDRALGGVVGADLHQVGGELGGRPQRPPSSAPVGRLEDEDHVDVGDVVELVAAALAHRDHGEPGSGGGLADPGAGDGERCLEGAGGEVGELGGDVVDAERRGPGRGRRAAAGAGGTPRAARRPPRASGSVATGASGRRVGAHGAQQRGPHGVRRRAGSQPSVGSVSSRQCSGWRARWSASAALAPRTEHSRIAVPSSSASSASIASRSVDARPPAASRPARAGSGSAVAARSGGSAARRRPAARCRASAAARRGSRGGRSCPAVVIAPRPASSTKRTASGRQARRARRGRRRSRASTRPGRCRARGGRRGRPRPRRTIAARRPRGAAGRPRRRGANRATWTSPAGSARQDDRAVGQPVTRSLFQWTRRGPGRAADAAGRRRAPRSSRRRSRPTSWPRGLRRDVAAEGDGDQLVAEADPERSAPAGRRLADQVLDRAEPRACVVVGAHRAAQHDEPVVRRQARAARRRPTAGTPRASHPASVEPGRRPAPAGSRPRARRRGCAGPPGRRQRTGSIRSRSKAETWLRYSSHSARLLRRKKSKTCSPSVSASSSESSAIPIAS